MMLPLRASIAAFLISHTSASVVDTRQYERRDSSTGGETVLNPRTTYFRQLVGASEYRDHAKATTPAGVPLKVGIVGSGAAGLYAAMLLDSLDIDYDIHEASGRIGGRVYTYYFNEDAWAASTPSDPEYYNYYDAGAMRFPPMAYMDRIIGSQNWSLIPFINERVSETDQIVQIPYIFTAPNTLRKYNDVTTLNQDPDSPDEFDVQLWRAGAQDTNFNVLNASAMYEEPIQFLIDAMSANFTDGFNLLLKYDALSVRNFFQQQGYSDPEIDWLETLNDATDHFDWASATEQFMDEWIFSSANISEWTTINGGLSMIIKGMNLVIKNKPALHNRVTEIKPNGADGTLKLVVNGTEEYDYAHVISTVPLGALQAINMTGLDLDYFQKNAIRRLQYDPSTKIGLKFTSRWWEDLSTGPFKGGQSYTDMPIRRVVYPSYGLNVSDPPGAMIASYVWGQDALRLGGYANAHNPTTQAPAIPLGEDHLVNMTLADLASLHGVTFDFLYSQLEAHHVQDWYQSEYSLGAFAFFGPGQFSTNLPYLLIPAWQGHMHFGGEALSSGHGWIIGALNSAWRNVMEILDTEGLTDKKAQLVSMWGDIDEVDKGWYNYSPDIAV